MARVMEIVTPLGEDVLLFHGMSAREEMSRLFEYQLDLLSTKDNVALDDILGKNVTIKFALPDDQTRYFNGYVTRFAQGGMYGRYHRYLATVRPWLWFLTRTADCRIFQEMKVPDIIKAVGQANVLPFCECCVHWAAVASERPRTCWPSTSPHWP